MIRRRIRSFVRRDSRITDGQLAAFEKGWPIFGLSLEAGLIDYQQVFGRCAPCYLEIGFGAGNSLAAMAHQDPQQDYLGVEMFKPGIGALLQQIATLALSNIRIYYADAVEVLEKCIPDESLAGIQIFFPDPWRKRRHHKRRLIQDKFVGLMLRKLKPGGTLHLATDWEDYAIQMLRVLSAEKQLSNLAGTAQFAARSLFRPLTTKFETRGVEEGRQTWELQFAKQGK